MAMISILGLYNIDNTIFDDMAYPDTFTAGDKTTLNEEILFECCELEILYPDPEIMKRALMRWSEAELPSWNRYANALQEEYNPLWNVDATIEEQTTRSGELTTGGHDNEALTSNNERNGSGNDTRTNDLSSVTSRTNAISGSGIDELSSTAFNTAQYRLRDKTEGTTETTETGNESTDNTGTVTNAKTWSDESETNDTKVTSYGKTEETSGTETHSVTRTGNIGVTSSQQLVEQEISLATYNIVRFIVDSFKRRFCILVY